MVAKTVRMQHPADRLSPKEVSLYQAIGSGAKYVYHASFDSPATEGLVLAADAAPPQPPAWVYRPDATDEQQAAPEAFTLSRDEETALFLQYNYARYRLAELLADPPDQRATAHIRQILSWYARAQDLRAVLVRANLPLVLTMTKRYGPNDVEFSDLVAEGNLVLLRCVENFDAAKGFKFSTYACRAIIKTFNRMAAKTRRYRQLFPTEFDPDLERSDEAERREEANRNSAVRAVRDILAGAQAGLRPVERTILIERYGIADRGRRKTLADVARTVGLSPERVRQLQRLALEKLRDVLANERIPA